MQNNDDNSRDEFEIAKQEYLASIDRCIEFGLGQGRDAEQFLDELVEE